MTFFHNLNKRLADLSAKQDLHESKVAESEKWIQKAVNPEHKGDLHKALHVAQDKKIPKAKIEKATHSKNPKLRHMAQFAKNVANEGTCPGCKCSPCECVDEGNAFTGKLKSTAKGEKFKLGNKEFKDTSSIEENYNPVRAVKQCAKDYMKMNGIRSVHDLEAEDIESIGGDCQINYQDVCEILGCNLPDSLGPVKSWDTDEHGNKFDLEEGFADMDAWLAQREKEKGTGKFDRKERTLPGGMKATTYTRKHDDEEDKDDEAKSDAPKKKGRPKGKDKGPERVTAKSYKYKAGRPAKTQEALDSDGVMMTRPTNCSSESIEHGEQSEYNDEAGMAKDSLHTIVRHAKELESALRDNENLPEWVQEKIGQIKGMMSSVTDYIISTHERDIEQHTGEEGISVVPEGWRGGLSGERPLVKKRRTGAETAYSEIVDLLKSPQNGIDPYVRQHLMKLVNELARQATKTKEMPVAEKAPPGAKAERMVKGIKKSLSKDGKLSDKDKAIAYATTWKAHNKGQVEEEGAKPDFADIDNDGDKKETMKQAAKQAKTSKKDKEEKVDETTVSGSVAPVQNAAPKAKGGMQFGKGVYESMDQQYKKVLSEGMSINVNVDEQGKKSISVNATEQDAEALADLLKMAGLGNSEETCSACGKSTCGCEELDENSPDWPTDTETLAADPELRTYSGGLNGPKSTGQTTVPVVASQFRRQASMEESVELERTLFKTWKNYKG